MPLLPGSRVAGRRPTLRYIPEKDEPSLYPSLPHTPQMNYELLLLDRRPDSSLRTTSITGEKLETSERHKGEQRLLLTSALDPALR